MNDVFTTLAVIGIILIWAFFAYIVALFHMDIGITLGWWVAQIILLSGAVFWIYMAIRWAVTT